MRLVKIHSNENHFHLIKLIVYNYKLNSSGIKKTHTLKHNTVALSRVSVFYELRYWVNDS